MTDAPFPVTCAPDDAVWSVLELVAAGQGLNDEPDERAQLLNRPDFDHGRLVEQAMRHGLLAALADYVNRHGLRRTLPIRLRNPVMSYLRLNEHRTHLLTHEAIRISAALADAGVSAVWTKGVILQCTLYDGAGVRVYNDVDLMIAPADRDRTRDALVALGYEPATQFDQASKELTKISRAAERIYQVSPDHLPHFHRLTGDFVVPAISVDVANSLTWHGSPWQVPIEAVLRRASPVSVLDRQLLAALSPSDSFLFLCLHLFREGWIQRTIELKDVSLAQFADISRQWLRCAPQEHQQVADVVGALGLADPIAWVSGHTDALFGTDIVAQLGLESHAVPDWLASAQGGGGRRLSWSGDMRQRLRDPGSPVLSVVPEPSHSIRSA